MYPPEGGEGWQLPHSPSSELLRCLSLSALGILPRMPWAPRPLLHTPASIKEGLGTGSRAWLPLEAPGKSRSISPGATGAGPSGACYVEATQHLTQALFPQLSLRSAPSNSSSQNIP